MKYLITLFLITLVHSFSFSQISVLHRGAQLVQCEGLSDDEISNCTDSIVINELLRAIEISACHNQDSSRSYKVSFDLNTKGKVKSARVSSWMDEGSPCKDYFQTKAESIAKKYNFTPAKDRKGNSISSTKSFQVIYPSNPIIDSLNNGEERYLLVEEMPRFNGCEHMVGNSLDKQPCSERKLLQFLYMNLKYPRLARERDVQGRVYVQFFVDKDGAIINERIVRDIGAGCGDSVLEVIQKMKDLRQPFIPGRQNGQAVRVLYTLPVTFKLEGKSKKKKKR